MKILHVVAGLPSAGGGISEYVPRLALEAARLGADVTIATVARANERLSAVAETAAAEGVRIVRFSPSAPRALFFSWELLRGLPDLARSADLVHVHSSWTFPVWWGGRCALGAGKPLVMSPHGCLDPVKLAHSAWKKRLAGFFDRRFLREAWAIHAASEMERDWIERYVGKGPRICVIPNGVEMPAAPARPAEPKSADRVRQVLYLGRLHPLKGLDLLLEAWKWAVHELGNGTPEAYPTKKARWRLVIAGPDEQCTRARLEAQARRLGLENVSFPGPLYGEEKRRALAEADLFVLPSRTENFGIAVAEALAAGVPAITTKGTPWSEVDGVCGWWVDLDTEAIGQALAAAMRLTDAERREMGERGRSLVEGKYRWEIVGRAMRGEYEEMTG